MMSEPIMMSEIGPLAKTKLDQIFLTAVDATQASDTIFGQMDPKQGYRKAIDLMVDPVKVAYELETENSVDDADVTLAIRNFLSDDVRSRQQSEKIWCIATESGEDD